jgi:hypothetical protein
VIFACLDSSPSPAVRLEVSRTSPHRVVGGMRSSRRDHAIGYLEMSGRGSRKFDRRWGRCMLGLPYGGRSVLGIEKGDLSG